MNQTATATTNTHPVDLETLRQQLEEDGKVYNKNPEEGRKRLLHTLQTNDCREIITAVVDGDDLAIIFINAGYRNRVDILEAFLNHGMKIDVKDKDGWTALMYLGSSKHVECVRFFLDRHASVNIQNNNGYTALMYASQNGYTKTVQLLLEKNANPDIQNESGITALMYASELGSGEIIQLLLSHGADIELANNNGETALDLAEDEEIKELLTNHVNNGFLLK